MSKRPIRIAILTRQEVVARGLAAMLSDYPERFIVTAPPSARTHVPGLDVLLYDALRLQDGDGAELDHLIAGTQAKVVLYSRDLRPDLRVKALAKGCATWISMSAHARQLIETIELILDGKPVEHRDDRADLGVGLTPRELETLALITEGLSNEEIAERLFLSPNTLKYHIRQCYRKIGASSRAQAVAWAMQHGLTPDRPDPRPREGRRTAQAAAGDLLMARAGRPATRPSADRG